MKKHGNNYGMILEVSNLSKNFGGLQVLRDVSFQMLNGEILGLIGPNGAGKTTLFNVVTGMYSPSAGMIHFKGEGILGIRPDQICRRGVARTFQLVRIFPTMTALENVLVGAIYGGNCSGEKALDEALDCLELFNLTDFKDIVSANLTYSDRKLVEIARAVASRPDLVLLDEPLSGLNPAETEKIMAVIRIIRDTRGISIIWIEHKTDAIFNLCDRVAVLDYGEKIAEGCPEEVAANRKVVEAYIGEPFT
jgi:branched-chain amino acid transport system ATP-binding protein